MAWLKRAKEEDVRDFGMLDMVDKEQNNAYQPEKRIGELNRTERLREAKKDGFYKMGVRIPLVADTVNLGFDEAYDTWTGGGEDGYTWMQVGP
ncbi:unnamed protein product [Dovyalis caffra]|uniref:Uncharacterized protein n=1 Tax=Dovyalis caffra TaxID=77055 RepID=A0AAV1SBK3_9ROSI|nr:unnamed protein product [Dovyalis caffra]